MSREIEKIQQAIEAVAQEFNRENYDHWDLERDFEIDVYCALRSAFITPGPSRWKTQQNLIEFDDGEMDEYEELARKHARAFQGVLPPIGQPRPDISLTCDELPSPLCGIFIEIKRPHQDGGDIAKDLAKLQVLQAKWECDVCTKRGGIAMLLCLWCSPQSCEGSKCERNDRTLRSLAKGVEILGPPAAMSTGEWAMRK